MISWLCGRRSIGNRRRWRSGDPVQPVAICGVSDEVNQVSKMSASPVNPPGWSRWSSAYPGGAAVIGSTGFTKEQLAEVSKYVQKVPCVLSPNMSIGVNLCFKVLAEIAKTIGDDYDMEIVEAHHRMKKDAPSGTAVKMAQVIAQAVNRNLEEVGVYARKGMIGERTKKEIGIQTLRAGDIVGEHTVMFAGKGERIEVTHRAHSRDTFAAGAVRAAKWVVGKKPGLYDMQDVLGLK